MRRFSIARLMSLVAFLAANFAAYRFLVVNSPFFVRHNALFMGLLPLADIQLIGLYFFAIRYRVTIRRARGSFLTAFVLAGCPILILCLLACLFVPGVAQKYVEFAGSPLLGLLRAMGIPTSFDSPVQRAVLVPSLLGVLLSGPPLLLSLALAVVLSRFRLVITPRPEKMPRVDTPS